MPKWEAGPDYVARPASEWGMQEVKYPPRVSYECNPSSTLVQFTRCPGDRDKTEVFEATGDPRIDYETLGLLYSIIRTCHPLIVPADA